VTIDIQKVIQEFRAERERIEDAILSLECLVLGGKKKRGRPSVLMALSKRRGRPPGQKNKPKEVNK
jgi:hypothetical protein